MARRQVIEICCDRCGKTENQESGTLPSGLQKEFSVTFHGKTTEYVDLCLRCRSAISGYVGHACRARDEEYVSRNARVRD